MQINAAGLTVVDEAGAGLIASVAAVGAVGVGRLRQEIESVVLVGRVSDFSGHLEAVFVEEECADCA